MSFSSHGSLLTFTLEQKYLAIVPFVTIWHLVLKLRQGPKIGEVELIQECSIDLFNIIDQIKRDHSITDFVSKNSLMKMTHFVDSESAV